MKRSTLAAFTLAAVLGLPAAFAQNRPLNQPPPGFTALFNSSDLSGWRGRQPNYDPRAEAAARAGNQCSDPLTVAVPMLLQNRDLQGADLATGTLITLRGPKRVLGLLHSVLFWAAPGCPQTGC